MPSLKLQHAVGVFDDSLYRASVADDPRIGGDGIQVLRRKGDDGAWIEAAERLADAGPLVFDNPPGDARLEDRLAHHLQVIGKASGLYLFGGSVLGHLKALLLGWNLLGRQRGREV